MALQLIPNGIYRIYSREAPLPLVNVVDLQAGTFTVVAGNPNGVIPANQRIRVDAVPGTNPVEYNFSVPGVGAPNQATTAGNVVVAANIPTPYNIVAAGAVDRFRITNGLNAWTSNGVNDITVDVDVDAPQQSWSFMLLHA